MTEANQISEQGSLDRALVFPSQPDQPISQQELAKLLEVSAFPQAIVAIDVNGTLITETNPLVKQIDKAALDPLKDAIAEVQRQGRRVILCSDSPDAQLREFGRSLGMSDGAIAENGNLISWGDNRIVINPLPGIIALRGQIIRIAEELGYQKGKDRIAPEFEGGTFVDPTAQKWAFGANRFASVSAFGPREFIQQAGKRLQVPASVSVDSSPNDHFLGIHPGTNFKNNKGRILEMIAKTGRDVIMIGNAQSDWADPATGVKCGFVAESRISDTVRAKAWQVSSFPLARGVSDILGQIA